MDYKSSDSWLLYNVIKKFKSFFYNISIVILFFCYIYPLRFNFIPGAISTRNIMGILGIAYYLCMIFNSHKFKTRYNITTIKFLISIILLPILSLIPLTYNNTIDLAFIIYPIQIILIYFAAYLIFKFAKKIKINEILNYFILCVIIQGVISIIMFLNPPIRDVLINLISYDDFTENVISKTSEFRLIGFGVAFYVAGIISSVALIFNMYKILHSNQTFLWIISYIFILISGICMARTTLIGFGLSLILICSKSPIFKLKIRLKILFITTTLITICCIIFLVIISLPSNIYYNIENFITFGFELFINMHESGSATTNSTNTLLTMYGIIPNEFSTWLIGDGLWTYPNSGLYYKDTDVGYFRLIFYFGIIGTIAYMCFQYYSVKLAITKVPNLKNILNLIFIFSVILNFKGFADIFGYCAIFYFCKKTKNYYDKNRTPKEIIIKHILHNK